MSQITVTYTVADILNDIQKLCKDVARHRCDINDVLGAIAEYNVVLRAFDVHTTPLFTDTFTPECVEAHGNR
jgi:hypothetical protein